MSFRGAKRRGNPLNRNANTVAIATDRTCSRNLYRATTLLSQNKRDKNSNHNSERVLAWWAHCVCRDKSVQAGIKKSCHSSARLSAWWVRLRRKRIKHTLIQGVLINGMCNFKDGTRAATAARKRTPSFRRTQAPFASTTTSCSCSPWFFVLLFPHDKNFAFIFDMQALVRLFLPCGSPRVRSTVRLRHVIA